MQKIKTKLCFAGHVPPPAKPPVITNTSEVSSARWCVYRFTKKKQKRKTKKKGGIFSPQIFLWLRTGRVALFPPFPPPLLPVYCIRCVTVICRFVDHALSVDGRCVVFKGSHRVTWLMKTTQAGVQKGRVLCATKHVLGKTPKIGVGRDHLLSIMLSLFSSFAVPVRFTDGCEMRVERGECQIKDGGNSFHTSPACPPAGGASLGFVAFSAQIARLSRHKEHKTLYKYVPSFQSPGGKRALAVGLLLSSLVFCVTVRRSTVLVFERVRERSSPASSE